jgi:hypothetical protein
MAVLRFLIATQADKFITRFKADLFQHFPTLSETLGGRFGSEEFSLVEALPWQGKFCEAAGTPIFVRRCSFTRVVRDLSKRFQLCNTIRTGLRM